MGPRRTSSIPQNRAEAAPWFPRGAAELLTGRVVAGGIPATLELQGR